jgi:iron complex transport system substrate-binding protein
MRVVSLLPSATELLCHIGGGGLLVGRSHECDFPPHLTHLPVLTGANPALRAGSGTRGQPTSPPGVDDPARVDLAVREHLQAGLSLYTLDVDRLVGLHPDLVITQDLCDVCSIDLESVRAAIHRLNPRPEVLCFDPRTVEDVFDDLLRLGRAAGLEDSATRAVVALRERFFRAADYIPSFAATPPVAFLDWTDPLYIGGHWTPQLIERAGGCHPLNPTVPIEDAGAAAGPMQASRRAGKSLRIPAEALIATAPEFLIICPCGVSLEGAMEMARALALQPWWNDLPAVRTGRVAVVDGNEMFNRPGPRLVDAYEWLVGWINERPELIPRDFPWKKWNAGQSSPGVGGGSTGS